MQNQPCNTPDGASANTPLVITTGTDSADSDDSDSRRYRNRHTGNNKRLTESSVDVSAHEQDDQDVRFNAQDDESTDEIRGRGGVGDSHGAAGLGR